MEDAAISLAGKPGAALHISALVPDNPSDTLVVFLNGLMLPRATWLDAITHFIRLRTEAREPLPALLSYDRFGQGNSDPDPSDPPDTPYGHDVTAVVADLHQLLVQVVRDKLETPLETLRIVLVCNSIGCAIARLYTTAHPGSVAGLLFLDPMMANSDFVSLIPDPASPAFDPTDLPADISVADLQHSRTMAARFFHPTVPNGERFDRRTLAQHLPWADKPPLPPGPSARPPRLTILGHDWDTFADNCETGPMSLPKPVVNAYLNPAWQKYNEGLTGLVGDGDAKLKIARGCGHFIQRDDPVVVATETDTLLKSMSVE
ncbi:Alpha/beta hydrolase fold-1 [Lasiosphaeris hirsuta]|uniref:Alpha/beta hydrolase fold-1 n=1 Tax=Lasiosphaeris hirsuta TaxID=260670 RepID=A0AA39ZW32_9PEZI|nr:Alpha/beta hydrolase fold-1 [Lasiosphaeris hirsuta]